MTRISHPMDWIDLEHLATSKGIRLIYRVARCQHGFTRGETCNDCENGYVDDVHTFANISNVAIHNGQPCVAVSDDGEDVAYIGIGSASRLNQR